MVNEQYDFIRIEAKWRERWEKDRAFEVETDPERKKYYVLEMFPYPSGDPHMGHVKNYVIGDVVARFFMRKGFQVLHPMGFDSFGLPAENAAIQHNIHPSTWTHEKISKMREVLKHLGISYDWRREVVTCEPEYYRFTQWLFLQLYRNGLAYKREGNVNWCPSCTTVLANEQVIEGICERCGAIVTKKTLSQWYFRITRYAESLLEDMDILGKWPERVLTMQRNWIGRSDGAQIQFEVPVLKRSITVFTTRPDTVFGATFFLLAPEHPLVDKIVAGTSYAKEVHSFREKISRKSEIERVSEGGDVEGMYIGHEAINPLTGESIPIWIADYIIYEYGTGAVMAVPAHDERDNRFAVRFDLPIRHVIKFPGDDTQLEWYAGEGTMINSGDYSGLSSSEGKKRIIAFLEREGVGRSAVSYRLRDWLISRQRYWGAPIPVIYCDSCGEVPVLEKDLPVLLPREVDFTPGGPTPLARVHSFTHTQCPGCGGKARRETDTMDTFVCSSWYFLRYCSPWEEENPFRRKDVDYWMPVDQYIGGVEHAILHLMYARFFTKVLYDLGFVGFREPFTNLFAQGMVNKDGAKMSKSRGNTVSPRDIVDSFGVDTIRVFILFAGPPELDMEWSERGVEGAFRFINRFWRALTQVVELDVRNVATDKKRLLELERDIHRTIYKVDRDIRERFHFNTAISAIMESVNQLNEYLRLLKDKGASVEERDFLIQYARFLVSLLNPIAPHISEELWERLGGEGLLVHNPWPSFDPEKMVEDQVELVIQINGKVRSRISVLRGASEEDVLETSMQDERVRQWVDGKRIAKKIFVPDTLLNIVVR